MSFTLKELAECAERELARRKRMAPNKILTGRKQTVYSPREVNMMEAIAKFLREEEQQWERLV